MKKSKTKDTEKALLKRCGELQRKLLRNCEAEIKEQHRIIGRQRRQIHKLKDEIQRTARQGLYEVERIDREWNQQRNSLHLELSQVKELLYELMRLQVVKGVTLGEFLGAHNFIKDKQDMEP